MGGQALNCPFWPFTANFSRSLDLTAGLTNFNLPESEGRIGERPVYRAARHLSQSYCIFRFAGPYTEYSVPSAKIDSMNSARWFKSQYSRFDAGALGVTFIHSEYAARSALS